MLFENTRSALYATKEDVKHYAMILSLSTQVLYIIYLIASLIIPIGSRYIGGVTLGLCASYLAFYIYSQRETVGRLTRRRAKRIYKWSRLAVKAVSLANTVYGIVIAAQRPATTGIVIMLIVQIFTIVLWVLETLLELIKVFVVGRIDLLGEAFSRDAEAIKKPVEAVRHPIKTASGFLGRVFGRPGAADETVYGTDEDADIEIECDTEPKMTRAERRRERRLADAVGRYRLHREEKKRAKKAARKSKKNAAENDENIYV